MSAETPINVVGGGAWGTALANAAAGAGHPVTLWLRDAGAAAALQAVIAAMADQRVVVGPAEKVVA